MAVCWSRMQEFRPIRAIKHGNLVSCRGAYSGSRFAGSIFISGSISISGSSSISGSRFIFGSKSTLGYGLINCSECWSYQSIWCNGYGTAFGMSADKICGKASPPYGGASGSSLQSRENWVVCHAGPITVPAWDQESRVSTPGLSAEQYALLSQMPSDAGEPPVLTWPQYIRVRVGGDLSYTKMLTGQAAERRAWGDCLELSHYRRCIRANPRTTRTGCELSFPALRAESSIGERMARSSCRVGINESNPAGLCECQGYPTSQPGECDHTDGGTASFYGGNRCAHKRFGNVAYQEPGYGKDWLPDCGVWDRAVDAPEFYKDDGLEQGYTIPFARSTASYRMYKPIEEVSRAGEIQDRTTGEPAYWRGRRRLRGLCGPIPDSGPASWIVCFPVALWRRTKSLEEHNNALRAECWVCPKISTPATCAGCESRADTRAGSSCGPIHLLDRRPTGLPIPPPMEVGPLPSRDPGFPYLRF